MLKTGVSTSNAPKAIGPYSQAVRIENFLFCSGQIGVNPEINKIVEGGIKEQTRQIMENIGRVLKAVGATFDDVVKTTVYMTDLSEYLLMNDEYAKYFKAPYPARATVQVSKLPKGVQIEIEAIAYINKNIK